MLEQTKKKTKDGRDCIRKERRREILWLTLFQWKRHKRVMIYYYLIFCRPFSDCASCSDTVKSELRRLHNIGLFRWAENLTQQTWKAPISGRRQDLTLEFRCAIRQPVDYVMRLKAVGEWVAASQRNASSKYQKFLCKSISVRSWGCFGFHR